MIEEERIYLEQIGHWFDEQDMISSQIRRTIIHHEALAESNRKQLTLHEERIDMARQEHNEWLKEHNLIKEHPPDHK